MIALFTSFLLMIMLPGSVLPQMQPDAQHPAEHTGGPQWPRLLIARPNTFGYGQRDTRNEWIAAVLEPALSLVLSAQDGIEVIDAARVWARLPELYWYERRISRQRYRESALATGATHIVYSEYESTSSRQILLHVTVIDMITGQDGERFQSTIELDNPAQGILETAQQVYAGSGSHRFATAVAEALVPTGRELRAVGTALLKAFPQGMPAQDGADSFNRSTPLEALVCSRIHEANRHPAKGADCLDGSAPPPQLAAAFAIRSATLHARAANSAQATRILASPSVSALAPQRSAYPRMLAALAAGTPDAAAALYRELLHRGWVEPDLHLLGAAALHYTDVPASSAALARYCGPGSGEPTAQTHRELGDLFVAFHDLNAALQHYRAARDRDPTDALTLSALARTWRDAGNVLKAAHFFEELLFLDALSNRAFLDTASQLYLDGSDPASARALWHRYLRKRRDPHAQVELAKLTWEHTGSCDSLWRVIEGLDDRYLGDAVLSAHLSRCRADTATATITLRGGHTVVLRTGTRWEEPGFSAVDGAGHDITTLVQVHGSVHEQEPGAYQLTYRLPPQSATADNAVRRTVIVEGQPLAGRPPGSAPLLAARILTSLGAVAGLAGGVYLDRIVISREYRAYREATTTSAVDRHHDTLRRNELMRNGSYLFAAAAGAGFGLSISIPRIVSGRNAPPAGGSAW